MYDPITLAAIASLGATGFGLIQGTQAKEDAEELAKKQAKQDAMMNLIRAAGGSPPVPTQQVAVPQVDYAGAMQNLANTGLMYAGGKSNQAESAANAAYDMERTAALQREAASMGSQPDMQTMRNVAPTGYAGPLQGQQQMNPLQQSQVEANRALAAQRQADTAATVAKTKTAPSVPNQATLRNAAPQSVGTQDLVVEPTKAITSTVSQDEMTIYRALQAEKQKNPFAELAPEDEAFLAKIKKKIVGGGTVTATPGDYDLGGITPADEY